MDLETFTFTGASLVYKLSDLVIQYPGEHRKFAFIKLSHWAHTQMNANFGYENSKLHKLTNFSLISVTIVKGYRTHDLWAFFKKKILKIECDHFFSHFNEIKGLQNYTWP